MSLKLVVLSMLVACALGGPGAYLNFLNSCDPPQQLLGKFCAAVFLNDVNYDGYADIKDFDNDLLLYNKDDDLCNIQQWELVTHWTCTFGWSEGYARFFFKRFDTNNDGVWNDADFAGGGPPLRFTLEAFLTRQYTRFQEYCDGPSNANSTLDKKLCAEVRVMKQEELKC